MSTASGNYFYNLALRQRYVDALGNALRDNRLRADEHVWLQSLLGAPVAGVTDPVRVDQLTVNNIWLKPLELSAALLLTHGQTNNPRAYLYTLADGVEVFSDRHALLVALRARFAKGNVDALFECEKVEGEPFRAQMLAIVDHQTEHVRQMTAQLKLTPTLFAASTAALTRQLRERLPHMSLDPQAPLLQIVPCSIHGADRIPLISTLAQAAFDDARKVKPAAGSGRRFLNPQGLAATDGEAASIAQALTEAVAGTAEQYCRLLNTFWRGTEHDQRNRRDLAIESFGDSLRWEIYRCRHAGTLSEKSLETLLPLLRGSWADPTTSRALRSYQLSITLGDSPSYPLAGTFVVQPGNYTDRSILWFSSEHKLVRFSDLPALTIFLATAQGREQLRPMLALQDQPVLLTEGQLRIGLEEIGAPLIADRVDSILALQGRNLLYAMGLPCASEQMTAMIDDALDLRQLLDPRQLQFPAGRWRGDAPYNFANVWLKLPVTPRPLATVSDSTASGQAEANTDTDTSTAWTTSWMEQSRAFDLREERLRQLDNTLLAYAEQTLQQYLCVLVNGTVKAQNIRVRWLESDPVESSDVETPAVPVSESQRAITMDLVSLLLERVSGHRPNVLPAGAQILMDSLTAAPLRADLINHVLDKAVVNFSERYVDCCMQSRGELRRLGDRQIDAAQEALGLREEVMRVFLVLAKRQNWIDDAAMHMVRQVLDRPVRSLRTGLGEPVTEAFSVSLTFANQPAALLCDTLVLSQPLKAGSPVMLWTSGRGWRQFSSVQELQATLQRKLHGPKRERWLAFLGERDRVLLRTHLSKASDNQVDMRLDRIDGHLSAVMYQEVMFHKQQDLRQLCLRAMRCRLEAGLFTRLAMATEPDLLLESMLDGLSIKIDSAIFEALVPPWLVSASIADLNLYLTTLKRYYVTSSEGRNFLFDVPPLQVYAREQLVTQLNKDFPDQQLNPDQIIVTSHHYVTGFPAAGELPSAVAAATLVRSESLTDYAINRFAADQGATLSIASEEQPQATELLTPVYLRQIARRLDVGAGYMALLRKAFAPDGHDYVARRRLFVEQLPSILVALALPEKLKGKLSATGFEFISHIAEMPDGIARTPVDGTRVIISPLQLVADQGMIPDPVAGVYLICPSVPDTGPVILYAIYHPPFVFREYASPMALLEDIRNDESLQQLLLGRLDPEVRRRYDHGGFVEPHLPFSVEGFGDVPLRAPGPVTLGIAEVKGNALQMLFTGTLNLLLDLGVANAVTNEQVDQAGRTFLATLGLEQALSLLPGKLASLVTLWQSHTLFQASAISASGRRWGEALSEFSAALGAVIAAREQTLEDQITADQVNTGSSAVPGEEDEPPSAFTWREGGLNTEQRMRLQQLEAKEVVLNDMQHDELLDLYLDKNKTPYAVVAGKVYQVRKLPDENGLIVIGADGTTGPRLKHDNQQHWQLDLSLRLRGGGGIVTRLNAASAEVRAEDVLIIEARGMPEIRALYRDRARRIALAHFQARRYLQTSLDNLNGHQPGGALIPEVNRIIGDFFGVTDPSPALLTEIETAIKTLFDAVMEDSLSPFSSPRFVVGSNRTGRETVIAFVIKTDPKRRVFLTDHFFKVPVFKLKPQAAQEGFEASAHYQAANLIHELSHLALDTVDIGYLESMAPYPDLLDDTGPNRALHTYVKDLHEFRLSHRSNRDSLFTLSAEGQWRDILADEDRGFDVILRLTETTNLDDARDVFLSDAQKRSRVMLSNADSLTLLVLRLGRRNHVLPSP